MKSYDITYFRKEAYTDKEIPTIEESVKADRLRLLVDKHDIINNYNNDNNNTTDINDIDNVNENIYNQPYTGGLLSSSGIY